MRTVKAKSPARTTLPAFWKQDVKRKPSRTKRTKRDRKEQMRKAAERRRREKSTAITNKPQLPLGMLPSSAVMFRFLHSRQPGSGLLPQLPAEVVNLIASMLARSNVCNVRLACKELESKTFYTFKQYFYEVGFMHSKYAFDAMVAMSKSRMAQYVRTLGLGPPSNDMGQIRFLKKDNAPTAKMVIVRANMLKYRKENEEMRTTKRDAVYIAATLKGLTAVTTLKFLEPSWRRGAQIDGTTSFGEYYHWNSVNGAIAKFTPVLLSKAQSLSRLVHITLLVNETSPIRLQCIDVGLKHSPTALYDDRYLTGFDAKSWRILLRLAALLTNIHALELTGLHIKSYFLQVALATFKQPLRSLKLRDVKLIDFEWVELFIWLHNNLTHLEEMELANSKQGAVDDTTLRCGNKELMDVYFNQVISSFVRYEI
ncbi:hypothetical protein CC80DRAFT_543453 [Byssothecium circinans]|uniref:F-box domain-containing protein n=1 Tax=Byssothecium circinans TaxID=147558 RepID=A0A6A5UB98_9PLEO|nr:hypothetical protein CC80DRAFT_543453 [Byssothecium circinans]